MSPRFDVRHCNASKRSDGVVLLTLGRATRSIRKTSAYEAIVALNQTGEIVWTRTFDHALMDCRRSLDDTLLVMGTDGRALEIDLSGQVLKHWHNAPKHPDGLPGSVPLETLKLHHTLQQIGPGRYLSLSVHLRGAVSPTDDWPYMMADTVVVFRADGTIEREFRLDEILDPARDGHSALIPYWPQQGYPGTRDWSHGNCAIIDPVDGGLLVSLRHQDCVAKISQEGALLWILGDQTGWSGPFKDKVLRLTGRPFYHQHDLSFTAKGELMLFDNGFPGAVPPNDPVPLEAQTSSAVTYKIDDQAMTATETWRFSDIPHAHYVSGVCEMPNGNRFIACTGIVEDEHGRRVTGPPKGIGRVALIEVTPEGERVFEAHLSQPDAKPDQGWAGFRPEYFPSELAARLA